jgi:shikimate kinase
MSGESVVLIGMPGAGKSTVGPLLADKMGVPFQDTDTLIRREDGRELKTIVAEDGFKAFLAMQQKIIMSCDLEKCVVATGGSVIKSDLLMRHLKSIGMVVYLKYEFETLERRLAPDRRLARAGGQSFRQVFEEREPLYEKYADRVIDCTGKTPDEIVNEISGEPEHGRFDFRFDRG